MFTGIVTGLGRVVALERRRGGARLRVRPPATYESFARGESVAVSGVCLTALADAREFVADLASETLRRTTLGGLSPGDRVNLERSLRMGDRISGHFVLGHVDGVTQLRAVTRSGNSWRYRFSLPGALSRYVTTKGSVALDGVSLTVAARGARDFDVAVIPETRRRTTLGLRTPGDPFNFEADVLARYGPRAVARLARPVGRP